MLFPLYHKAYWIGLKASSWPLFNWIDPGAPGINTPKGYKNWGFLDGQVRAAAAQRCRWVPVMNAAGPKQSL